MTSAPELKPCPFCCGPAREWRVNDVACADELCPGNKMRHVSPDHWNRRADLCQPTSNPIKRAEYAAGQLDRDGWPASAQAVRDLIAALQAAPTAEQLREWSNHLAGNWMRLELRAAAERMADAVSASDTMGE